MQSKVHPIRVVMGVMFGTISVILCGYMIISCVETGAKLAAALNALLIMIYINDMISVMWNDYRIKTQRAEAKFFILPVFELILLIIYSGIMAFMDCILFSALFRSTEGFTTDTTDFIIGIANILIIPILLIVINNIFIIILKLKLLINRRKVIGSNQHNNVKTEDLSETEDMIV